MIRSAPPWLPFDGLIPGASFASGDTVVAGCWRASPFGAFVDLMWARPDGTRLLIGPDGPPLEFVWSHYRFEQRVVADAGARVSDAGLHVTGGPLSLDMTFEPRGALSALLRLRPQLILGRRPWVWLEDVVFRPALAPLLGPGIRMRGLTRSGAFERYAVHDLRVARCVRASIDGEDLGSVTRRPSPAGFGFSEFPRRAGAVRVTTSIKSRPELSAGQTT